MVEVAYAISEVVYIAASTTFIFIFIEILASFFISKEHIHFSALKSEIYEECELWDDCL